MNTIRHAASASFDDPLDRYYLSMSYEEDRNHAG